jgi:hypothetical protein
LQCELNYSGSGSAIGANRADIPLRIVVSVVYSRVKANETDGEITLSPRYDRAKLTSNLPPTLFFSTDHFPGFP